MKTICPRCGQSITAMAEWVGSFVNCPKCGKKVLIAGATDADPEKLKEPDSQKSKAKPAEPKESTAKATSPKQPPPAKTGPQEKRPPGTKSKDPFNYDDDDDDFRLTPAEQRPKAAVVEDDFRLSPEESRPKPETLLESSLPPASKPAPGRPKPKPSSPAAGAPKSPTRPPLPSPAKHKTAEEPCPNCGAQLPPDGMLCVECGYHLVLKRVLQADLRDMELDGASGFQRWMNKQIAEGESVTGMLWILHAVLLVIAIAIGLMFSPIGWWVVGPAYAVYFLLVIWIQKSKVYLRLGDSVWNWMLRRHQRRGWREASPPFRKRNAFVSHDREFNDQALGEVPNMEELEVLDLQGTGITDAALYHIQYCAALKYAVLRGTKVTAQGAKRLQVMKPDLYIWF